MMGVEQIESQITVGLPTVNSRIEGCRISVGNILAGGVVGFFYGGVDGAIIGFAGGSVAFPGLGSSVGAVGGFFMGGAIGFIEGVGLATLAEVMRNCGRDGVALDFY